MVITLYAIDFEYDGQLLSDYGFIICDFNSQSGANVVSAGSQIKFNTVQKNKGSFYNLTSTQYDECIKTTFGICKNPDIYDDLQILDEEYRELFRWLNRKEFLKFRIVDEENEIRYYNASFNISKVKIREILYGLELSMETNRPYAYGEECNILLKFDNSNLTSTLYDFSDEIGYLRPHIIITCKSDGDLIIQNDVGDCKTVIKNCVNGEIIYLDNENQIISSSMRKNTSNGFNDICHAFNYDFFKIGNTYRNRVNTITVTIPCEIEVRYSPIIKDSL